MRNLILIIFVIFAIGGIVSCSRSESHVNSAIDEADRMMQTELDSAMVILDAIDLSELTVDSIRAQYHYLKAYGHMRQNRSMIADSLVSFSFNYYRDKDIVKDMRSGTALAWYKFWIGDTPGAVCLLDSLVNRKDVPDSLMEHTLLVRVLLGASEYQGQELIPLAKRLVNIESDTNRKMEAKYLLISAYENAGKMDSALMLIDELIGYAYANKLGDKQFVLELERAQILTEIERERESDEMIDRIFRQAGADNGAADLLHLQCAVNALNTGDIRHASRELAVADSFATILRNGDDAYYRSYSNLLHAIIDFGMDGRIKLSHINGLYNRQRERYNRMEASQWESERGALQQQSRALALRVESGHKTVAILVVSFLALFIFAVAAWMLRRRRFMERENEERAEALKKMVDDLKNASHANSTAVQTPDTLRRAMLHQLGIIKMVAETPTEQNREMLRRISSINGDTGDELVNWNNVFELIDNIYHGFHHKLHDKYGDVLNMKEEQIIALMMAGFSTKEISVITGQTTSTIYVRKSTIRKKLGLQEKEDIMAFFRSEFAI